MPARRRYPRYATVRPASVAVGIRLYPGRIVNASLGGMCITTPARAQVGDQIVVRDRGANGAVSYGTVAWVGEGRIGLCFQDQPAVRAVTAAV